MASLDHQTNCIYNSDVVLHPQYVYGKHHTWQEVTVLGFRDQYYFDGGSPTYQQLKQHLERVNGHRFQFVQKTRAGFDVLVYRASPNQGFTLTRENKIIILDHGFDSEDVPAMRAGLTHFGGVFPPPIDRTQEVIDMGEYWYGVIGEDKDVILHGSTQKAIVNLIPLFGTLTGDLLDDAKDEISENNDAWVSVDSLLTALDGDGTVDPKDVNYDARFRTVIFEELRIFLDREREAGVTKLKLTE